ncbi:MAG TPA: FAD-dependent oxidoreductase [Caulobacteraceae bacterium]|nr:FAD-dependent oxidoreductase [Caulobacteraceae bacterium]
MNQFPPPGRLRIAVVGAGISGLSAAWLLSRAHEVVVYEADERAGGHSCTVDAPTPAGPLAVDMGFIVYNEPNYPNLTALLRHLGVETRASNMGFAVSLDDGAIEYGGDNLITLFSQWRNLVRPRFWSMLSDLLRFYREAPGHACALDASAVSLGEYLAANGYGRAFQDDHLIPQAAAIWSASAKDIRDYPAGAFIRFCENHGLLQIARRPTWRTVAGGARTYVERMIADGGFELRRGAAVEAVMRRPNGVLVRDAAGGVERFDQVVLASHADQTLRMLEAPSRAERELLGAFAYTPNRVVLHSDASLMPRRRGVWSAWNYLGRADDGPEGRRLCVSYWMNRLQDLPAASPLYVTLNPTHEPAPELILDDRTFDHPRFDAAALSAQRRLWSLQGVDRLWYCGAHFGAGFHEDGLQSGLAVAEQLGGVRRPWQVDNESARIALTAPAAPPLLEAAA